MKYLESAKLLLPDPESPLSAAFLSALSKKTADFTVITDAEQIEELLNLYSTYRFTDKLVVASFTLPYGDKLQNLYHAGIITMQEYAEIVVERL